MVPDLKPAIDLLLPYAICISIGFITCFVLIPVMLRFLERSRAGHSRSFHHTHTVSIPRYGGLALACAFGLLFVILNFAYPTWGEGSRMPWAIALGAGAIFALGFWDDLKAIGPKKKLVGQIGIAVAMYFSGLQVSAFQVPGFDDTYLIGPWAAAIVTILWLTAIPNLVNLIDGTDGLAGGVSLMLMCLLSFVAWERHPIWSLAAAGMSGALLGFLRYNFPPARIYLGDGGAYLLGFLIAAFSLASSNKGTVAAALTAPLLALALPIIDVSFAIVRRSLAGLPLFRPDRKHIHHRLRESGLSRTKTVLTLYSVSFVFLVLAFAAFWSEGQLMPALLGIVFLFVIIAGHSAGLLTDWAALCRTFGNSRETRRETQYALTLIRWLEMEAERCDSIDELWTDFAFVTKKLGFTEVTITGQREKRVWRSDAYSASGEMRSATHHLHFDGETAVVFAAPIEAMDQEVFELLAELSAEAWLKTTARWRRAQPADAATAAPMNAAAETSSGRPKSYHSSEAFVPQGHENAPSESNRSTSSRTAGSGSQ